VVLVAAIVLALLVADVVTGLLASHDPAKPKPTAVEQPKYEEGRPFGEPPVVRSRNKRLKTTLVAQNGTVTIAGVQVANTETYAASSMPRGLLGPTLRVEPGDTIDLTLDNRLRKPDDVQRTGRTPVPVPVCPPPGDAHAMHGPHPSGGGQLTNLHFHGLHVTPLTRNFHGSPVFGDNVLLNLPPGKSHFRFRIPADHDQGTFWYHAHRHGCTDDQVFRGLAGLLLIGDSRRTLPVRFRHVRTRSIALRDIQAVPFKGGWAIPNDHDWGNENPTQRTVNGLVNPTIDIRPGETQLWRIADTSAAVWYRVALLDTGPKVKQPSPPAPGSPQDEFMVIAADGNPATRPQRLRSVVLGPGHRVDILVRAPAAGEQRVLSTLPFDQGRLTFPELPLATVNVGGPRAPDLRPPGQLKPLPKLPRKRGPARTFTFSFEERPNTDPGGSFAFINGLPFDPNRVDANPRLGTTERWTLVNRSSEWHPFHIHQDDFRVVSVNGKRVTRPPGDQDVVGLPPVSAGGVPGRVVIDMPFTNFRGKFVFHCHILDHEDGGMMALVNVR
jgi:FtsP/CotA-like multicopper oxidase with cupredoxin domain